MGAYYSSDNLSSASVTELFTAKDHEAEDRVHALTSEFQNYTQRFQEAETCHKKEIKKLKEGEQDDVEEHASIHVLDVGRQFTQSSSSDSDQNNLAVHDPDVAYGVDPDADPMDPDYH